jgi:hypothetical protein
MLDWVHSFPAEMERVGIDDATLVDELALEQPRPNLVQLKNPQLVGTQFGKEHRRFILSLDKGMGKTLVYMQIAAECGVQDILILCTRNAMLRQEEEINKHFPEWKDDIVFVKGDNIDREKAWNKSALIHCATYATFLADMGHRKMPGRQGLSTRICPPHYDTPEFIVCDEYHRVLRNRSKREKKNATLELLKLLGTGFHLVLSSGSAANKGPHSMWAALNLCAPKVFTSYWGYVNTYCVVDDTPFGKQIVGVKNVPKWRHAIAPYCFHRKKDLKDYPPKTRQALPVEMEPWQKKVHDDLKKDLIAILPSDAILIAPNTLAATHKIRQLMICPRFLDESLGWGAGLEGIWEDVETSELTHYVITTPYTGPMPLIGEFFKEKSKGKLQPYYLRGGMDMDAMRESIQQWTKNGGPMIQSIEFAESYELPASRIMYMLGYSHDPERNMQAEDRIHRDIRVTPDPVDIYYVKHKGGYDEKILEALTLHSDNVHYLMNAPISEAFNL